MKMFLMKLTTSILILMNPHLTLLVGQELVPLWVSLTDLSTSALTPVRQKIIRPNEPEPLPAQPCLGHCHFCACNGVSGLLLVCNTHHLNNASHWPLWNMLVPSTCAWGFPHLSPVCATTCEGATEKTSIRSPHDRHSDCEHPP